MKKHLLFFALFCVTFTDFYSQIIFDHTYNALSTGESYLYLTKFGNMGYKYVQVDIGTKVIKVFNVNHTLNTSINVPLTGTVNSFNVSFVSDNLFNLNNNIEYVATVYSSPPKVYIFDDTGAQLFFKDSTDISQGAGVFSNQNGVFYDGTATKMKLERYTNTSGWTTKWEIYTLPGSIPCVGCSSSGTVTGIPVNSNGEPVNDPLFFPNPVKDQLKLKYELPKNYKNAEIKIYDLQGKNIENYKITDTFDFIYLPSDFNNGLYIYSLYVDDKLIKSEKIVLTK